MELGAVVCTARTPDCAACPIRDHCAWRLADYPAYAGPRAPTQRFTGTDRQVRGRLLDVLRQTDEPATVQDLDLAWPDDVQRLRALDTLVADGLVRPMADGRFALGGAP